MMGAEAFVLGVWRKGQLHGLHMRVEMGTGESVSAFATKQSDVWFLINALNETCSDFFLLFLRSA